MWKVGELARATGLTIRAQGSIRPKAARGSSVAPHTVQAAGLLAPGARHRLSLRGSRPARIVRRRTTPTLPGFVTRNRTDLVPGVA